MRKRRKDIHVMLNDEEYSVLRRTQNQTGLILRELLMNAISEKPFVTSEYTAEIRQLKENIIRLSVELRKIGVNINQLARVSNTVGDLPTMHQLQDIKSQLDEIMKTGDEIWQSSKQLTPKARPPTER